MIHVQKLELQTLVSSLFSNKNHKASLNMHDIRCSRLAIGISSQKITSAAASNLQRCEPASNVI